MTDRWRDKVEAAIEAYGDAVDWLRIHRGASSERGCRNAADAARAALLELVTEGRCPECGGCMVPIDHFERTACDTCGAYGDPLDTPADRP